MQDQTHIMSNIIPTVLTANALVIARTLDSYGLDSNAILRQAGLDPAKLFDANARFSFPAMTTLWHLAVEATADPCFGLKAVNTGTRPICMPWVLPGWPVAHLKRHFSERNVMSVSSTVPPACP